MKTVTLFINSIGQGGAERQLLLLGKCLIEKGYRVELVTYVDIPDHYQVDDRFVRIRIAKQKSNYFKLFAILKFFNNHKTNCVISFAERNNFMAAIGLMFRKNIKLIASERNFILNNNYKIDFLRKILYRRANAIVPNSYSQGEYLGNLRNWINRKIVVITNYTDVSKFSPNTRNLDGNIKKICVFARYDPQKNYIGLINCVNKLVTTGFTKFRIDWYGAINNKDIGVNKFYSDFKSLIEFHKLSNYIHLFDAVHDVEKVLLSYNAFCLPSLFEGFSNSLSEAISCGLPAIVSNVSDNSIMVEEGRNGYLFDPTNTDSMSEAFCKFITLSKQEENAMGIESRNIAKNLFDIERFTSKYINIIEN